MDSSPSLSTISSSQSDYDKSPYISARPSTDNVVHTNGQQQSINNSDGRSAQTAPAGIATSPWGHAPVLPSTPPKNKSNSSIRSRNSSARSNGRHESPQRTSAPSNGRHESPQRTSEEVPQQRTVKFARSPQYAPPSTAATKRGLDLKARLYDRPQDAQVFQTINTAPRRATALVETQVGKLQSK